jgi:hypothetical protein
MIQAIKGSHEKEVNSLMEQQARLEVELGKFIGLTNQP